jgi:hypothetical protein
MSQCWVIGDAAVDLIPEGNKYLKLPGGTGANVAVALSRLGVRSALVTKLGNDPLAAFLTNILEREKVNIQHVYFSERYKTGLIIVSVNSTGERHFTHMVKPSAMNGAISQASVCGHNLRPSCCTSRRAPKEKKKGISRGHHSLTPNSFQPICINQNSNGGLCE